MNVLSLYDGMSCGRLALERAKIPYANYFASEIDKFAIEVAQKNYPDTIQLGDVRLIKPEALPAINLLIGGSPCQGFSFIGKHLNFKDSRSALFFDFVKLKKSLNPEYFLLENVKMKQEYQDIISEYLGVKPIEINSDLVSAQSRRRLYWTNIPGITQPVNKNIHPSAIIQTEVDSINNPGWQNWWIKNKEFQLRKAYCAIINDKNKAICMTARQISSWNGNLVETKNGLRFITPVEAERLQTMPDDYTDGVSDTQRYKMIGNGWTIDVIAHILSFIPNINKH